MNLQSMEPVKIGSNGEHIGVVAWRNLTAEQSEAGLDHATATNPCDSQGRQFRKP